MPPLPLSADDLLAQLGIALPRLEELILAGARVLPSVILVPAFGLRAWSGPVRIAIGLSLAASISPSLGSSSCTGPLAWCLFREVLRGLPVALAASVTLWTAVMAGGLADELRGSPDAGPGEVAGETASGTLLGILAAVLFLEQGGPAHLSAALLEPPLYSTGPLLRAAAHVAGGVRIAVALVMPLVVASMVVDVGAGLIARAATPARVSSVLTPLKGVVLVGLMALILDRVLGLLALLTFRGL